MSAQRNLDHDPGPLKTRRVGSLALVSDSAAGEPFSSTDDAVRCPPLQQGMDSRESDYLDEIADLKARVRRLETGLAAAEAERDAAQARYRAWC